MNEPLLGSYAAAAEALRARLREPPPGRVQLLVGPRQVGKTTLLLELARELGPCARYVAADAPESALPGWADRLLAELRSSAARGPCVLLLDEVHAIPGWSRWLKSAYDVIHRERLPVHLVASGSSALNLTRGTSESLAGRFERIVLSHWGAADLVRHLGIAASSAPLRIVTHGGYPGAVRMWRDVDRWKSYLRDAIVEPAVGRDILHLEPVRKPALLRQVFALAAAHPAQILSLEKMAGSLTDRGALETIAHYLQLLQQAFLVAAVLKYSPSVVRRRRSPPKLVVLNAALMVGAGASPPDAAADPVRWGQWVENACLAHAVNHGQDLHYWREEPWEVDGIIHGTWGDWMLEVKTGHYDLSGLRGLAEASQRFPELLPVVLCDPGRERTAREAGFAVLPWTDYLMDAAAALAGLRRAGLQK
jgi:hypothetical protein